MATYFYPLSKLDTAVYRKYFMDNVFDTALEKINAAKVTAPIIYHKFTNMDEHRPVLDQLEKELQDKYNFPYKVNAFLILIHHIPQQIHIDAATGRDFRRYVSINLPLANYAGTRTVFFNPLPSYEYNFIKPEQVTFHSEFKAEDQWSMVNPDVPHHVVCDSHAAPRVSLALSFEENPTFEQIFKDIPGLEQILSVG